MKKPELTDTAWLGPREEMDRASHCFGKCSECHEIICVEKAVTDGPSTHAKTSEMFHEAFRAHVKLKHSEDFNLAAIPAPDRHEAKEAYGRCILPDDRRLRVKSLRLCAGELEL